MQDHITRTRLAGEPPHVMLVPRLRNIGLMEFNRAHEAIDEGHPCVEQALPTLKRYLYNYAGPRASRPPHGLPEREPLARS